ncbi:MAG: cell division protein ZapE, partial [Motiliproteus sp.]
HPDQLYADGVQRDRFLPAINHLKANNHIYHLDGGQDHRLRPLGHRQTIYCPVDTRSKQKLLDLFTELSTQPTPEPRAMAIENRSVNCLGLDQGVIWFDFSELCDGPRSPNDYIYLSKNFHTLLISNIPLLGGGQQQHAVARGTEDCPINNTGNRVMFNDDRTRRFISLIDELYDHSVKLIANSAQPIESLYCGGHLEFEFQRTSSRLIEMQSEDYWQRPHRP